MTGRPLIDVRIGDPVPAVRHGFVTADVTIDGIPFGRVLGHIYKPPRWWYRPPGSEDGWLTDWPNHADTEAHKSPERAVQVWLNWVTPAGRTETT